jgi:hypothetical protein
MISPEGPVTVFAYIAALAVLALSAPAGIASALNENRSHGESGCIDGFASQL